MSQKSTLILSPEKRTEKPKNAKAEHSLIHDGNMVTITWEELAIAVTNGQSFCHAIVATERKSENFVATELLVLDIDNKETKKALTIKDALSRLKEYGIDCNLIYTSFSDTIPKGETDTNILMTGMKYRIIFKLPEAIYEFSEFERLLNVFYHIFPEADPVSRVQLWYGGKNIAYANFDYVLDLEVFYSSLAIHRTSHLTSDKRRNEKVKKMATSQLMNGYDENNIVSKTSDAFNIYKTGEKKGTHPTIRNYDWEWACSQFDLLDSFLNCKKKIYYVELYYLYLAMRKIEGGAKKWKEAVKNNPEIDDQKQSTISYYLECKVKTSDYQLFESRISNYAPDDKAAKSYNLLTNISNKLNGKIEIIDEGKNACISTADASIALNNFLTEAKHDTGNGKYVIKCATGLGKTEEIIRCNNLEKCVIAVPTHKLKEEVSERLSKNGVEHYVIPDLPILPAPIKEEYDGLSSIGAYNEAAALLWQIESGKNVSKYSITPQELQRVRGELSVYFKAIEDCQDTTFPVLTTHKKLLTTHFPNHSTCIIDEDIFSSLYEVNSTTVKDLRMLLNKLNVGDYPEKDNDIQNLTEFLNSLEKEHFGKVMDSNVMKGHFSTDSLKKFVRIALKHKLPLEGSIIGLFSSDLFVVSAKDEKNDPEGEKEIFYLKKKSLPMDMKIIVLSATANKEIYEQVLGKVEWCELSQVEQIGNLVQIYDKSFSRAWMNRSENKDTLEYVRDFAMEKPVITFKKQKNRFNNSADVCLESCEGVDALKGQDIVVVGTPHLKIEFYALLATALGIQFSGDDLKLEMVKCEYGNYSFDFYSFKHEGLRKIQLYKIESQLIQACGRARAIREQVNVHLFSSFPLAGFEKITLDELKHRESAANILSE